MPEMFGGELLKRPGRLRAVVNRDKKGFVASVSRNGGGQERSSGA